MHGLRSVKTSKASMDIILVTFQRDTLLSEVLASLAKAVSRCCILDYHLKIFINGPDPKSLNVVNDFQQNFPIKITLLSSELRLSPAEARNRVVLNESSVSNWLFFIDDDITIPENIFSSFCDLVEEHPSITVWGGPNITPLESTAVQKHIGWILNSWWVIGPVHQRYSWSRVKFKPGNQYNLMLCNLIVNTKIFTEGPFQSFFKTAEENELLVRLKTLKTQFGFSDELFVYHQRRNSWSSFLKQIFYYGYGRGQLLVFQKLSSQFEFLLYLVAISLGLFGPWFFPMAYLGLLVSYFFFSYGHFVLERQRFSLIPAAVCPLVPVIYYFGIVFGILFEMVRSRRDKWTLLVPKATQL